MRPIKSSLQVMVLALLLGFVVSGCTSKEPCPPGVTDPEAMGATESIENQPPPTKGEARTTWPMVPVYFDFDSSSIRADQVQNIERNGGYLKDNTEKRIRVEGNCDARGTNEYNLALGERRAQTAKKYLVNLGVDSARISTVSWGEEKPLLHGHDELSWEQNRRDDFVVVE